MRERMSEAVCDIVATIPARRLLHEYSDFVFRPERTRALRGFVAKIALIPHQLPKYLASPRL